MENVSNSLKTFMEVFADSDGFTGKVYDQFFLLVDNVFGQEGTTVLQKYVDVTDNDIFYVRSSYYAQFMSEVLGLRPVTK